MRLSIPDVGSPDDLAPLFADADPFPHVVLDGAVALRPEEVAQFPDPGWAGWHGFTDDQQRGKRVCNRIDEIPEPLRELIRQLNEPRFLEFLESVTGMSGLIPDPHLEGGGLHSSGEGGVLAPHTDFHVYTRLGLYRQLNVIVYLDDDWEPEDGGCLQLFEGQHAARTVVPELGRMVIFKTDDRSVHGFTNPIAPGRVRRSVALYYYTSADGGGFGGGTTTYWRQLNDRSARGRLYRLLLGASRMFSYLAYRVNAGAPSTGPRSPGRQTP